MLLIKILEKREKREKQKKKSFSGMEAATTMINYSQLGKEYIRLLQDIIKRNKLFYYDKKVKQKNYSPASLIATD
jgi:Bax protein